MTDTLAAFLGLDDPVQLKAAAKALQQSPELNSRAVPSALRAPAAQAIMWTAKALLTDPLSGVIGDAWGKVRDMQRFISAPPDEINTFTLHEHEIALSRRPAVELELNGAPTGIQLHFELKIGITITSAALKIQNARLIGADFSGVRGGGSFSCGRATIAERKTGVIQMPARLNFTPGVPLQ